MHQPPFTVKDLDLSIGELKRNGLSTTARIMESVRDEFAAAAADDESDEPIEMTDELVNASGQG